MNTDKKNCMPNHILISGHSRFGASSVARSVYEFFTVVVEVDTKNWKVISVDVTLVTPTAKNFLCRFFEKYEELTENNIEKIKEEISYSYFGGARKTILSALDNLKYNFIGVKQFLEKKF